VSGVVRRLGLYAALTLTSGCVQHAVLENDVRSAEWKARTLATASNLGIAEAALSAQLVELEALYQRDRGDARIGRLLARGYELMARGFIEARRLEALAAGDVARATFEEQQRTDAESRARYYGAENSQLARDAAGRTPLASELSEAEAACQRHDRSAYEKALHGLLTARERAPEERLERALLRRLAALWLTPAVAARCSFPVSPAAP
jgi:hypothetical protein